MVATVKLRKQGGSLAVTLPKEVVRELGVRAGEGLHLVQVGPGEVRVTPHDPETVAAMLVFLALNRRALHVPPAELYALVMAVATKEVTEAQVATWIRQRWDG